MSVSFSDTSITRSQETPAVSRSRYFFAYLYRILIFSEKRPHFRMTKAEIFLSISHQSQFPSGGMCQRCASREISCLFSPDSHFLAKKTRIELVSECRNWNKCIPISSQSKFPTGRYSHHAVKFPTHLPRADSSRPARPSALIKN